MSGLLGYGACYEATHQADVLLPLGPDFPYNAFLPRRRTVQVDHDLSRLGRRTPLDLAVHGDVGATLRAVLPLVKQKTDRSFLDETLQRHARARARGRRLHARHRTPCAHPSRACGERSRSGGRRRRRLHRRDRHVQRLGGALHHPERPATRHRIISARHDGQRAPARHRRAVRISESPGDLDVGRRRAGDVARRAPDRRAPRAAGEDHHVQQLDARHGHARDARRRHPRLRRRPRERRLRRDRRDGQASSTRSVTSAPRWSISSPTRMRCRSRRNLRSIPGTAMLR